jgi:hypothetical protein
MALERGTEEYQLFTDYWALCKKYWILNDTDEWWERAINDTNRFIEKYKNSKSNVFALKIGTALIDHLESQKNTRR